MLADTAKEFGLGEGGEAKKDPSQRLSCPKIRWKRKRVGLRMGKRVFATVGTPSKGMLDGREVH